MEKQTLPQWLPYELRRLGKLGLVTPVMVLAGLAGMAGLMRLSGSTDQQVAHGLVAGLELGLPLAVGLLAAHVVASEPALDLQLTLKTRYRTTLLRRMALLLCWTGLFAFVWALGFDVARLWMVPGPFLLGQLAWVAPLLWFVSAGMLLALLFRSDVAANAELGLLWLFENTSVGAAGFLQNDWLRLFYLFPTTHAPGADFWLSNRLAVICLSLVLLGASLVLMRRESLSTGGEI